MPTAREALLHAALTALSALPWSGIRMVDIASAAGVSRQTLYNEFGSKDGLARALVRREADAYLHGVDRLLHADRTAGCAERLVAVAEWTVGEARGRPLLRALLTGCWGERLPAPRPGHLAGRSGVPAQRRADAGHPAPAELAAAVRDRSLAVLEQDTRGNRPSAKDAKEETAALAHRCELAVRLALSYVVAPTPEGVGQLVRAALGGSASGGAPVGGTAVSGQGSRAAGR
ncbi:TetR/AcrR family transcriptional regulator [Streptomyces sp. FIT100]|uniref:TetR/AcrR family transcriptional regulator n=1 Tax=Streptomyces sp. FIT100 TaxID=2837956 RepID=UPI0021CA177B|nr:TetR/AcrR family transcriptional regulator [Streptomyces sp. FIT100]UUN29079.1 TetR/AcrR family transcriptional regulator [Streptomyces sp. FIT100]